MESERKKYRSTSTTWTISYAYSYSLRLSKGKVELKNRDYCLELNSRMDCVILLFAVIVATATFPLPQFGVLLRLDYITWCSFQRSLGTVHQIGAYISCFVQDTILAQTMMMMISIRMRCYTSKHLTSIIFMWVVFICVWANRYFVVCCFFFFLFFCFSHSFMSELNIFH